MGIIFSEKLFRLTGSIPSVIGSILIKTTHLSHWQGSCSALNWRSYQNSSGEKIAEGQSSLATLHSGKRLGSVSFKMNAEGFRCLASAFLGKCAFVTPMI